MKVAVITAIFGGYDELKPIKTRARAICVTDADMEPVAGWQIVKWNGPTNSPEMNSRFPKCLPMKFIHEADYSIWCDGSIQWHCDPVSVLFSLETRHVACFQHRRHRMTAQEVDAVLDGNRACADSVMAQTEEYKRDGFLRSGGFDEAEFFDLAVIVREHSTQAESFGEKWWAENTRWNSWDQLSFNYTLWKTGLGCSTIPGRLQHGYFCHKTKHKKGRP